MSRHKHRCGFHDGAPDGQPEAGCGHIFEHEENFASLDRMTRAEIHRLHMCPKCGRGPWLLIYGHTRNANLKTKLVEEEEVR